MPVIRPTLEVIRTHGPMQACGRRGAQSLGQAYGARERGVSVDIDKVSLAAKVVRYWIHA